ncbi:MAG TPA: HNH endonuclease family protein [Patescibacteria group bacterium]|jgi:hypothetical protein|nr:HNH endonuclease family protein [Patescibacteria group bacterium]
MNARRRRLVASLIMLLISAGILLTHPDNYQVVQSPQPVVPTTKSPGSALSALSQLDIKGRAAKTGYARAQFGDGWREERGCDTRNIILARDMTGEVVKDCKVYSGQLNDPYTGKIVQFRRGADTSDDVQIDHVVALSNAWQTGAAYWTMARRIDFANDPLELLAVDGAANQAKSDGDAATWLPVNKAFRCQYVARQITIKQHYGLWVTAAEHDAMQRVLGTCPDQQVIR